MIAYLKQSNLLQICRKCGHITRAMASSSVIIQTDNVNSITEMVTKRHKNSSAEILAAFQHFSNSGNKFSLKNNIFSPEIEPTRPYPPSDMKITLKIFLQNFSAEDVRNAVDSFLSSHSLDTISQLIVSFPYHLSEDLSDEDWLKQVSPVWSEMEKMVDSGTIHTLGVADLDVARLRQLSDSVESHSPSIDHYSIDGCCAVPAELVSFAKEHDIQLLTHNDSRNLELDENVKPIVQKLTSVDLEKHKEKWTSRYTIWLRSRSVVAGKGYFINFEL